MPDSVRREIVDDVRAAKKFRLPWWAVLSWMACCAVILWPLYRHDRLDLGLPLLNSIGVCVLAIVILVDVVTYVSARRQTRGQ
jgi:hypothetical protein